MNLEDYSNPIEVYKKAKKIFGNKVLIRPSTRKNKKYMIYDTDNNKWVHFGQMGYSDFTKHNDEGRKHRFLTRNHRWAETYEYSPAYLSYHLLW